MLGDKLNACFRKHQWLGFLLIIIFNPLINITILSVKSLKYFFKLVNPKTHREKVQDVQKQVKTWLKTDQSVPMCTSRPSWMSFSLQKRSYKSRYFNITVDMDDILELDELNQTVLVEPSVNMGQINEYLQRRGWTLPIVPEINCLTVGGLIMGGGVETTSKKYGIFNNTALGYELVLADASVIWCDKDNYQDLFMNTPFTQGTVGFLTAIKFQIVPIKKYLKITYQPVRDMEKAVDLVLSASKDPLIDAVEAFVYSKEAAVVMTGTFVDDHSSSVGFKVNPVSRWYKPWFYTYAETFLDRQEALCQHNFTEYIPTMDYYQRHDRTLFWIYDEYIRCWNHPLIRYTLGWMLPLDFQVIKMLASKLLGIDFSFKDIVVQDLIFDPEDVVEVLDKLDKDCKVFPIWLCPILHIEPTVYNGKKHQAGYMVIDLGVYGFSNIPGFDTAQFQKKYENLCLEKHGAVAVWTKTMLTREQFDALPFPNSELYNKVRKKYNLEKAFPHVYDKISFTARD